ncbi:cation transporter [Candidatus Dependentiae bacterium]|nr:cation transporter [Candidatus Dependentiae bacterium]
MPYKNNDDLPESIKNVLPEHAQTIFRKAFNSAIHEYDSEKTAMKVAWSAVKKDYEKKDDKWVKK